MQANPGTLEVQEEPCWGGVVSGRIGVVAGNVRKYSLLTGLRGLAPSRSRKI